MARRPLSGPSRRICLRAMRVDLRLPQNNTGAPLSPGPPALPLEPQQGDLQQPRVQPWVRHAHKIQALKGRYGRNRHIAIPPLQGSLKIPRHTQGVALGYKYAAPLGLCGGAMPHVLLFLVCKSLPRRQLHGPTPFVGAFTPHLPSRHAGRFAFASKQHRRPTFSGPPGFAARAPTGRLTTAQGATLGPTCPQNTSPERAVWQKPAHCHTAPSGLIKNPPPYPGRCPGL